MSFAGLQSVAWSLVNGMSAAPQPCTPHSLLVHRDCLSLGPMLIDTRNSDIRFAICNRYSRLPCTPHPLAAKLSGIGNAPVANAEFAVTQAEY